MTDDYNNMLYLFYGANFDKVRTQSEKFLKQLFAKKPRAILVEMDAENFAREKCEECIISQGLFERHIIAVLSRTFENKEAEEYLLENLELFAGSANVFIFLEGALPKKTLSLFEKQAEKIWFLDAKTQLAKKEFNSFLLTDAVGRRDKRKAWALLQEALAAEAAPENIHGILFWHIKTMLSVKMGESRNEKAIKALGLKPFVLQKNRAFCKNYSLEELKHLSSQLVRDYHEAHRGGEELPHALERFVLTL